MIIRSLLSMILALIISVFLIINGNNLLNDIQNKSLRKNKAQIESKIYGLKITEFQNITQLNNNTKKKTELTGKSAITYANGLTQIKDVNLKIYAKNQDNKINSNLKPLWLISSNSADYFKKGNKTHFIGNVIAVNKSKKIKLESESLWNLADKKIMTSNTDVIYQMPQNKVFAKGVEIDYYRRIIRFSSEVKSLLGSEIK